MNAALKVECFCCEKTLLDALTQTPSLVQPLRFYRKRASPLFGKFNKEQEKLPNQKSACMKLSILNYTSAAQTPTHTFV